jgi:hypothetical protein
MDAGFEQPRCGRAMTGRYEFVCEPDDSIGSDIDAVALTA